MIPSYSIRFVLKSSSSEDSNKYLDEWIKVKYRYVEGKKSDHKAYMGAGS